MAEDLSRYLAFERMHDFLRTDSVRRAVLDLILHYPEGLPWEGENQGLWERLEAYRWVERGWTEDGKLLARLSSHLEEVLGVLSLGYTEAEERIGAEAKALKNIFERTRMVLASGGNVEVEGVLRDLEGVVRGQMGLRRYIEGMLRSWKSDLEGLEAYEGEDLWKRIDHLNQIGRRWHERLDSVLKIVSSLSKESLEEKFLQVSPKVRRLWILIQRGFIQLYASLQGVLSAVKADLDLEGGLQERLERLEASRKRKATSLEVFQLLESERVDFPPALVPLTLACLLPESNQEEALFLGEAIRGLSAPFFDEEEEGALFLPPPEEEVEDTLDLFLESFARSPSQSLVRHVHKHGGWDLLLAAFATLYLYPEVAQEMGIGPLRFVLKEDVHGLVLWDILKEDGREEFAGSSSQAQSGGDGLSR